MYRPESFCKEYFLARYSRRLRKEHSLKQYDLPPNKSHDWGILPMLLNDKEFYNGRLLALAAPGCLGLSSSPIGRMLWEVFGDEPRAFIGFVVGILWNEETETSFRAILGKDSSLESLNALESFLSRASRSELFSMQAQVNLKHIVEGNLPNLRKELEEHHLGMATCPSAFVRAYKELGGAWSTGIGPGKGMFPFEYGLCEYIKDIRLPLIWSYFEPGRFPVDQDSYKPPCKLLREIENNMVEDEDCDPPLVPRSVHVLFSVSGTGKTTQMMELLCQKWGFYLLSPNLPPENTVSVDNAHEVLLEPRRMNASKDTLTMFLDSPHLGTAAFDLNSLQECQCEPLLVSRISCLEWFCRRIPFATPRLWLQFQLSCGRWDPFDAAYRLFRLGHGFVLGFEHDVRYEMSNGSLLASAQSCLRWVNATNIDGHDQPAKVNRIFTCVDETQTALEDQKAQSLLEGIYSSLVAIYALSSADQNATYPVADTVLILSGTALNKAQMVHFLDKSLERILSGETSIKWKKLYIHHKFPVIASDQQFWTLFRIQMHNVLFQKGQSIFSSNILSKIIGQGHGGSNNSFLRVPQDGALWYRPDPSLDPSEPSIQLDLPGNAAWILPLLRHGFNGDSSILERLAQVSRTHCAIARDDSQSQPQGSKSLLEMLDRGDISPLLSQIANFVGGLRSDSPGHMASPPLQQLIELMSAHSALTHDEAVKVMVDAFHSFPELRELEDTKRALVNNLCCIYLAQALCNGCKLLRGRFRWSALYIESILLKCTKLPPQPLSISATQQLITEAGSMAWDLAAGALHQQLDRLVKRGQTTILQDLYSLAIDTEVIGRPSTLRNESSAQLISEGFAFVQRLSDKDTYSVLSEPVAIYAIIRHLRESKTGRNQYESFSIESLLLTSRDWETQSSTGKFAEWHIAYVSR
jgi:hypothetical protein